MISSATARQETAKKADSRKRRLPLGLTQLRWVAVGVPVVASAVALHVIAFALPRVFLTPGGYVLAIGLVVVAVVFFSHFVFAMFERLERRILAQNARLVVAASVAAALSETGDQGEIMGHVLEGLCPPLGADAGFIRLLDRRTGSSQSARYGEQADIVADLVASVDPAAEGIGEPGVEPVALIIDDAGSGPGLRSFISMPLTAQGRSEGMLALASRDPRHFDAEDRRLIQQIAHQVGVAAQRSALMHEVLDSNRELRLMNGLATDLSQARELQEVLDVVLRVLVEASTGTRAEFWLENGTTLELAGEVAAAELSADVEPRVAAAASFALPGELRRRVVADGTASYAVHDGLAHACLPLRSDGHVFGVVSLIMTEPDALTPARRRALESIAEQSGPAVSNARLRLRVREVAVLEERGRIAREMHDGVAQVLGYVNTKASAIRRSMGIGEVAVAQAMLADLEEAARELSVDVREDLLALRSAGPGPSGLCASVRAYLEKYERLTGIEVDCRERGALEAVRLPEMAELQVMRVVQEALSNVRKHARVSSVVVTLSISDGCLVAGVEDQGPGFDHAAHDPMDWPRFGLQTMRERAESIGARLSIRTTQGQGTQVRISVPLDPATMAAA